MGSNAAVCNLQKMFVYHYPERSNTLVSDFLTVVDWSKDDSTYQSLLSPYWWLASHQIEKELLNHWKGTSHHSVIVISTIDHPGICSWHAVILYTACWFRPSPSYSLLLSRMVYCHFSFSLLEILHFRKWMQHDMEHERRLLLTYHQLIPPFSSKPQVSLCCIITFVFRVIICVNPTIQEQSVCMTRNMKTWFQMFQPWIHIYIKICKKFKHIYSWTFA